MTYEEQLAQMLSVTPSSSQEKLASSLESYSVEELAEVLRNEGVGQVTTRKSGQELFKLADQMGRDLAKEAKAPFWGSMLNRVAGSGLGTRAAIGGAAGAVGGGIAGAASDKGAVNGALAGGAAGAIGGMAAPAAIKGIASHSTGMAKGMVDAAKTPKAKALAGELHTAATANKAKSEAEAAVKAPKGKKGKKGKAPEADPRLPSVYSDVKTAGAFADAAGRLLATTTKVAYAIESKNVGVTDTPPSWTEKYVGTPLIERARSLEEQELHIREDDLARRARQQKIDHKRGAINLQKEQLDLELTKHKNTKPAPSHALHKLAGHLMEALK